MVKNLKINGTVLMTVSFIVIVLFFSTFLLSGANWNTMTLEARDGVIEMTAEAIENGVSLEGDWLFYPGEFIIEPNAEKAYDLVSVPHRWTEQGYGTYAVTITDLEAGQVYGLYVYDVVSAYELYIDSEWVSSNGKVGKTYESESVYWQPELVEFKAEGPSVDVVIQISNFHMFGGGFTRSIKFGSIGALIDNNKYSIINEMILFSGLLIIGLYNLSLYLLNASDRPALFFSLFNFTVAMRVLITGERLINNFISNANWNSLIRLQFIVGSAMLGFFVLFVYYLFDGLFNKVFIRMVLTITGLIAISALIFPLVEAYAIVDLIYLAVSISFILYFLWVIVGAIRAKIPGSVFSFIGSWFILGSILFDIVLPPGSNVIPLGTLMFLIFQSLVVAERKNDELRQINESLEVRVSERTTEIRALLDNAGQGFLAFEEDLIVRSQYSLECEVIFAGAIGGENILGLMEKSLPKFQYDIFESAITKAVDEQDTMTKNLYLSVIPEELKIGGRHIKLEKKLIGTSIMLILTDITDKKALEKAMEVEKNNLRMVVHAVSNLFGIKGEINDFESYMNNIKADKSVYSRSVLKNFYRMVHTYKGTFSQFYFHHAESKLHKIEEAIKLFLEEEDLPSFEEWQNFIKAIDTEEILYEDKAIIAENLGIHYLDEGETIPVEKETLDELENSIVTLIDSEEAKILVRQIRKIKYKSLRKVLLSYEDYVQVLAESVYKDLGPLEVRGQTVFVDNTYFRKFTKALIHIFRNCVDHGIELPEVRESFGKPEQGKIFCEIIKGENRDLTLQIGDDGSSMDTEAIREKIRTLGLLDGEELLTLSNDEIHQYVFKDRFSTKEATSHVSGRGVGLSAVKGEVEALGGTIQIISDPGQGTMFEINIPYQDGMEWQEDE